jgi:hypothetical protein
VILKSAKQNGASEEDLNNLRSIANRLQGLKIEKGTLYKKWNKSVFKVRPGDSGILNLRNSEILDLFGKFYTLNEVHRIITDKWGAGVTVESLQKFCVENKSKIDRKKADYILNSKELRLATDAGRLELLSMLAYEMEVKFEKNKSLEVSKELRGIIEQIRKEVKGDEIKLMIDGRIDINATIQANQTVNEMLQRLPINMIVIGLTAAKQRLNPAGLIASLGNSYYSKFNGFNELRDKSEVQLPGYYIKQYNWDDIEAKNKEMVQTVEPIEVFETVEEVVKPMIKTKREEIKELLERYKRTANE